MTTDTAQSAQETARQLAEALGPDVSVGEPITAHGQTIIPLVRVSVSTRGGELGRAKAAAAFARWESEPIGLIITAEGRESLVYLFLQTTSEKEGEGGQFDEIGRAHV